MTSTPYSRIHGGLERSVVNTVAPSSRCAPCKTLHCYALDPLFYMHRKPMDVKKELDHFCSCNFWQHKVIGTMPKSDPYNKYNSSLKICCSCWVYYCACVDASICVHIDLISCLTRYEQWVDDQLPECCSKTDFTRLSHSIPWSPFKEKNKLQIWHCSWARGVKKYTTLSKLNKLS